MMSSSPLPEGNRLTASVPPGAEGASEGIDARVSLRRLWRIVLRWKWVIAGIMSAAIILALLLTLLATPRYTATVLLEISRQRDNIVDVKGTDDRSSAVDLEFYQTQYSLLKARSLAARVATRLNLAGNDDFLRSFKVDPNSSPLIGRNGELPPVEQRNRRQKAAIDALLENVTITPIRASALANVSFTSPDRQLSTAIVNTWAAEFIDANLERRFEAAGYARTFLEKRLVDLRARLEDSERKAVGYAASQQIINLPGVQSSDGSAPAERSLAGAELERLDAELTQATADRLAAESRLQLSAGSTSEAIQSSSIATLRQKRAELAADYASLMTKFEPAYPPAHALASQIAALDQSLRREESRVGDTLSGQYRSASAREKALSDRVTILKSRVLDLRRRTIQYNIYQRDVDTNRELYNGLLQRYKEIGIAGGVGTNNVSIADAAVPPEKASSPRLLVNLLLGALFGLIAAAISVFALEQIDETLKDPADIARATGLALLGVVPNAEEGDPIAALDDRKSTISEAYLSVQTSLQFATDHGAPRSLAVTSTRASEGKSATAHAIAKSLLQTRRRPILIDADMRSPSVHANLGIANSFGVSNFLAGDDDIERLVALDTAAGFAAMAAGPQPPNAAELLTSDRMQLLIARLLDRFDHVVVDAPPVLGLADAPLIASKVEGVIYVIEANGARASMIRSSLSRLRLVDAHLLGAVLTRFNPKQTSYDYGYGYGYGHRYGETVAGRAGRQE